MFEKVLVLSDGTPVSDSLLKCVEGLRAIGCREAVLCHVIDVETAAGLLEKIRQQLQPKLEQQQQWLEARGIEATIEMPVGLIHVEVNRLVAERGCSLIVVATHRHNLARDLLVGVTACSVIRHARVPVLLARVEVLEQGERCRNLCGDLVAHVLFATDFSAVARYAFEQLLALVGERATNVTLMHVQERSRIEPHLQERLEEFDRVDRERLERMAAALKERGATQVEIRLVTGHPTQELLKEAERSDYSLVMLGAQGRGFFSRQMLGGVAHRIANHVPLPVLLVPAPEGANP